MSLKVKEQRVRRMAGRYGYKLKKSPTRDEGALDYGQYALIDLETDKAIHPEHVNGSPYWLDLHQVDLWLQDDDPTGWHYDAPEGYYGEEKPMDESTQKIADAIDKAVEQDMSQIVQNAHQREMIEIADWLFDFLDDWQIAPMRQSLRDAGIEGLLEAVELRRRSR